MLELCIYIERICLCAVQTTQRGEPWSLKCLTWDMETNNLTLTKYEELNITFFKHNVERHSFLQSDNSPLHSRCITAYKSAVYEGLFPHHFVSFVHMQRSNAPNAS